MPPTSIFTRTLVSTERLVRHLLVAQIVGSVDDYGFHWA